MAIQIGSMRNSINNIYQKLINDEELIRLLYYYPQSSTTPDPLDSSLPNLVDNESETYWEIVQERVLLTEKINNIEDKKLCRIYMFTGSRRPDYKNHLLVTQEVYIYVFVHEEYDKDLRLLWISDKIAELLALEPVAGIGKLEYAGGDPRDAPKEYVSYEHRYRFSTKKD